MEAPKWTVKNIIQNHSNNRECHGIPPYLEVVGHKLVLDLLNSHKPGRDGLVDERGVGSPAEGVRVHKRVVLDKTVEGLEMLDDDWTYGDQHKEKWSRKKGHTLVSILDIHASKVSDDGVKVTIGANWARSLTCHHVLSEQREKEINCTVPQFRRQ